MQESVEFVIIFVPGYLQELKNNNEDTIFWNQEFITVLIKRNSKTILPRSNELDYITVTSIAKIDEERFELKVEYAHKSCEMNTVYESILTITCNSRKLKEVSKKMHEFKEFTPKSAVFKDMETDLELHPDQLLLLANDLVKINHNAPVSSDQELWDQEFQKLILSKIVEKIVSNPMDDIALKFPVNTNKLQLIGIDKVRQSYNTKFLTPKYRLKVIPLMEDENQLAAPIIILIKIRKKDFTRDQRTDIGWKELIVLPHIEIIDIYNDCSSHKNKKMIQNPADQDNNNNNNTSSSDAKLAAKSMMSSILSKKHKARTEHAEVETIADSKTQVKKLKLEQEESAGLKI